MDLITINAKVKIRKITTLYSWFFQNGLRLWPYSQGKRAETVTASLCNIFFYETWIPSCVYQWSGLGISQFNTWIQSCKNEVSSWNFFFLDFASYHTNFKQTVLPKIYTHSKWPFGQSILQRARIDLGAQFSLYRSGMQKSTISSPFGICFIKNTIYSNQR